MKKEKKSDRSKESDPKRHAHRKKTGRPHPRPKSPPLAASRDDTRDKEGHHEKARPSTERKDPPEKAKELTTQDIAKEDKSLVDFVEDKDELIEQLFLTIHGDALQKLIPDSLKNFSVEELKKMCLEELKKIPKDIVVDILAGNDPDLEEQFGADMQAGAHQELPKTVCDDDKPTLSAKRKIGTESGHLLPSDIHTQAKRFAASEGRRGSGVPSPSSDAGNDALELYPTQREIDSLSQGETVHRTPPGGDKEEQEKLDLNDRDILELELRARVLRSLLKSQGVVVDSESEKASKVKKVPGNSSK